MFLALGFPAACGMLCKKNTTGLVGPWYLSFLQVELEVENHIGGELTFSNPHERLP